MIFIDTSALAKRYVLEPESPVVIRLMEEEPDWAASALALTETSITPCRADLDPKARARLRREFELDWSRFLIVSADADCLAMAANIGCERRLRTLDAIQLAAAVRLPQPLTFLSFDERQSDAARAMGLATVTIAL
jgi:uncharacterized protein